MTQFLLPNGFQMPTLRVCPDPHHFLCLSVFLGHFTPHFLINNAGLCSLRTLFLPNACFYHPFNKGINPRTSDVANARLLPDVFLYFLHTRGKDGDFGDISATSSDSSSSNTQAPSAIVERPNFRQLQHHSATI